MTWEAAEFVTPSDALALDHRDIAVTAVIHDDYTTVCWAINVKGPWNKAEELALAGADGLADWLASMTEYEPDGG